MGLANGQFYPAIEHESVFAIAALCRTLLGSVRSQHRGVHDVRVDSDHAGLYVEVFC